MRRALSTVERVLLLSDVSIFSGTDTEDLALIAAACRETRAEPGEVVYHAGDPADALHLVVEGRVVIEHGAGLHVAVEDGKSFGTWALFESTARLSTATSQGETHLLTLERDAFFDVVADHVGIAQSMLSMLAGGVRRAVVQRRDAPEMLQDLGIL